MGKYNNITQVLIILVLHLGTLCISLACPTCTFPPPPPPSKDLPCPPPPRPVVPKSPPPPPVILKSPPPPPPVIPKSPPPPPPVAPKSPPPPPPVVPKSPPPPPPVVPKSPPPPPPVVPKSPPPPPPVIPKSTPPPPPTELPCPPPPPPKVQPTCPINTLKLGACIDVLGGLIHIGIGSNAAKDACCPVLQGVAGLDAALCLCTTIKAKLLNANIFLPIALQVLVNDCGKTPPSGFTCPSY